MSQMSLRIGVIGAGPAGCILGRLLHLADIECTIFEAEESLDFRSQGGTLDLRLGLDALKAAGVHDEYLSFSRYDGSALTVCDKKGWKGFYIHMPASKHGNPEIDRAELRGLLLRSLPEGMVRWSHRLLRVDDEGLHFEHGVESGFDLIVGADGAWSKVRNALTDEKPFFSGVAGYNFTIPNAAETAPTVSKFVDRGSVFSFSDGKSINAQQLGTGDINVSTWMVQENPLDTKQDPPTKDEILVIYKDWSPDVQDIIRATDGLITPRSLFMLPVGSKWKHKAGLTLIGDAAHLMTPFGGEGVNLAFEDALRLSRSIIDASEEGSVHSLDTKIKASEEDMFTRARKAQVMTEGMMKDMLFTPGAPRTTIASWILRKTRYYLSPSLEPFAYPIVAALVHTIFFVYKLFV
jgi:2-polyprenyl-6-methoxyphenol hydroxylase-like FAD-dependent oxidoreductase